MRLGSLVVVCGMLAAPVFAAEPGRRMVVTVDDLPVATAARDPLARQQEITTAIVTALAGERVPAVGFVNGNKLEVEGAVDPGRVDLLRRWLDHGLELGNHSWSHPSLHRVPVEDYQADILKGETVLRPLAAAAGRPVRYFRHPFLMTGRSLEVRDRVTAFLQEHGYQIAPVTVDTSDWIFAKGYDRALAEGDRETCGRLAEAYLAYMEAKAAWYEGQAEKLFGRRIPQVLLIHASMLNARLLPRLLRAYQQRGYTFVPLAEALSDEAYRSPDTFTGGSGISWLDRWALTRGMPKEFFAGEPHTPEWVMQYARVDSE